jgi:hypothetical protein
MTTFIKKVKNKLVYIIREQEEYWFGQRIIKNSPHTSPDFMLIGAAKAGTTSLFQYLAKHPDIIPSKKKELLYFSVRQKKGLKWYLCNFPLKKEKNGRLTFEGSPSYLYYKKGLKRIKHLFPDIKLIILLRDPINRAYSQWNYNREGSPFSLNHPLAKDERSFNKAIQDELNNPDSLHTLHKYIYRSHYSKHLKEVYKRFSDSQILVLDFDDLKKEPRRTLTEVTDFLQLEPVYHNYQRSGEKKEGLLQKKDTDESKKLKSYNVHEYKKEIDPNTKAFLRNYFKPFDKEIVEMTGKRFSWMNE